MYCTRCGAPNPDSNSTVCPACREKIANESDATGGLIPYKNPQALASYYMGLFSIFPVLGIFLSVPALILGIIGLRNRARNPHIRGSAHAWVGIGCGGIMTLIWGAVIVVMVVAVIADLS